MRRHHRLLLCVLAIAAGGAAASAQTPTTQPATAQPATTKAAPLSVDEIVNRTNRVAYYPGADGRAQVAMTIVDDQGRKRNREFMILRWDQPKPGTKPDEKKKHDDFTGEQKFYVFFRRPADVNKMGFLVHKRLDKDDDRWLYLPALDLVKRIAAGDKRTSFVGSDFFYEDVSGRNVNADTHELVETTRTYYVLKNTPKDAAGVEFSHFVMHVHRESFVVVRTDYFDKQGKLYRRYQALEVKPIQGYPTVTKSRMEDMRTKGHTILEYEDVKYDLELPEDIFAERYLRRPPYNHLR